MEIVSKTWDKYQLKIWKGGGRRCHDEGQNKRNIILKKYYKKLTMVYTKFKAFRFLNVGGSDCAFFLVCFILLRRMAEKRPRLGIRPDAGDIYINAALYRLIPRKARFLSDMALSYSGEQGHRLPKAIYPMDCFS